MKRTIMFALTALSFGAAFPVMAACTDPAGTEVDWKRCNLGTARLTGANFTGANLTRAKLKDAILSGTIWTDGSMCAVGSVGTCD